MSSDNPYNPPAFSFDSTPAPHPSGVRNVKADINDILNYSFKVWKQNLGLLVTATLIVAGISFGFAIFNAIIDFVLRGGTDRPSNAASVSAALIRSIVSNVVQIFLGIGNLKLLLALLRGQNASLGMLFSGGDRLLATIGVSILLGLAVAVGLLLLIVPGIIVMLFYWPAYSLVVDQKTPVMESFSLARTITKGNVLTTFLVVLLSMGIIIVGFIALCIGVFVTQSLAMLLFACAYLVMSGQIDPRSAPSQLLS